MEKKGYLDEKLEDEKGRMKKKLWEWGQTLERCGWKQDEIRKLTELQESREAFWRERPKERLEQAGVREKYEEEIQKRETEIIRLLQEKARIDEMLEQLEMEERQFAMLRFQKGYGFDYIGLKLHMGRATLFRLQDRLLYKMQKMEIETQ